MATDPDRTSRAIKGDESVKSPTLEMRMGEVKAVDVAKGRLDITLGGGDEVIPSVSHMSNYRASINDVVWVLANGPDLLVMDRAPALGPSVMAHAGSAYVAAEETRTATTYGDLVTVGPSINLPISPSGRSFIQVSAVFNSSSASGGAAMSFEVRRKSDNAVVTASSDERALYQLAAGANRWISASRIVLVDGLAGGEYIVTAKYRSMGGTARFSRRWVWTLPL